MIMKMYENVITIDNSSANFYFHWFLKKILFVLSLITILKQQFTKQINGMFRKNKADYFHKNMINIKNFFPDQIEIDQKYYNDITTYYIGYFTIKNTGNINIHSVSPLYLIFNEVDG